MLGLQITLCAQLEDEVRLYIQQAGSRLSYCDLAQQGLNLYLADSDPGVVHDSIGQLAFSYTLHFILPVVEPTCLGTVDQLIPTGFP